MAISNPDFASRAGLNSIDLVVADSFNWNVGAGLTADAPRVIPRVSAGVLITADALFWIELDGQSAGAGITQRKIAIPVGGVVVLGLELQSDILPRAFNPGAGAQNISLVVLRRRRMLEKVAGQV